VVTGLNGHMQMGFVQVSMAGKDQETLQPLPTPSEYERVHGLPVTSPAYTVAHSYERLVREVRTGQSLLPDFDDGVQHHRLLAAIDQAVSTGTSTPVATEERLYEEVDPCSCG
jgi:hypothetical protein